MKLQWGKESVFVGFQSLTPGTDHFTLPGCGFPFAPSLDPGFWKWSGTRVILRAAVATLSWP